MAKNTTKGQSSNDGGASVDQTSKTDQGQPSAGVLKKQFNTYALEPEVKILIDKATYDKIIDAITSDPILQAFLPVKERDERTNVYYDTKKKFHLYRIGAECRGREKKPAVPAGTGVAGKMATFKYDLKTPHDLANPQIGPDEHNLVIRGERSHNETFHRPRLTWFAELEELLEDRGGELTEEEAEAIKQEVEVLREYLGEELTQKDKKLVPWAGGTFQRHITEMSVNGSAVEIAIEKGRFHNIEQTEYSDEFYVIELESKGDEVNLDHLIEAITQLKTCFKQALDVDLETSGKTKGEMAFEWLHDKGLMPEEIATNFEAAQQDREDLYTERRKQMGTAPKP